MYIGPKFLYNGPKRMYIGPRFLYIDPKICITVPKYMYIGPGFVVYRSQKFDLTNIVNRCVVMDLNNAKNRANYLLTIL